MFKVKMQLTRLFGAKPAPRWESHADRQFQKDTWREILRATEALQDDRSLDVPHVAKMGGLVAPGDGHPAISGPAATAAASVHCPAPVIVGSAHKMD